jgi:epoxyqueuosine reductase
VDLKAVLARLDARARALGFSQIGVADVDLASAEPGLLAWLDNGFHGAMDYMARHGLRRARPAELVPGTVRVITARMDYLARAAPDDWQAIELVRIRAPEQAAVSLYARGRDYHKVLRSRLQALADGLADEVGPLGHRVFTDSAPVLEVELATRSGLGWRGKHTLALDREGGSMFFLGEIYVDVALPLTPPASAHCGSCTACLDACPTGAIVAPQRLDARRCISYLTIEHPGPIPVEWRAAIGNRVYGCDDCQLVCPWNRWARRSPLPDFDVRDAFDDPTPLELWSWDEATFRARTEGSAIRRIGHERWQRNLAVVLGNALRASRDPEHAAAIARALAARRDGAGALVREHIDWALAQRRGAGDPANAGPAHGSDAASASQSGMPTIASSVETVTSPATNPPSPPMRAAST